MTILSDKKHPSVGVEKGGLRIKCPDEVAISPKKGCCAGKIRFDNAHRRSDLLNSLLLRISARFTAAKLVNSGAW
ncbi:MAG: hypothetical protein WCS73_03790 [Lentisphaeria bacterium]